MLIISPWRFEGGSSSFANIDGQVAATWLDLATGAERWLSEDEESLADAIVRLFEGR